MKLSSPSLLSKPYALVVDDDPGILEVYEMTLSDLGFQPIPVANGFEALQKALAYEPVLVIVDHVMPGLSGTEFTRQLRQLGLHDTAVVLVSAGRGFKAEAERAGANASLEKPFDVEDLICTVTRLVPLPAALSA